MKAEEINSLAAAMLQEFMDKVITDFSNKGIDVDVSEFNLTIQKKDQINLKSFGEKTWRESKCHKNAQGQMVCS